MRRVFHSKAGRTALASVLAAGSLVILWLACLAPSGRVGLTAAAGLFPMSGVLAGGPTVGYFCWIVSGLLGLILLPDKSIAFLYLIFLGLYPVVKSHIEGLRRQWLEWTCKLVCFNVALTLFWFLIQGLFPISLPSWIEGKTWLLYLLGNGVFVIYDIGLSKLIALLLFRFRKQR